ncbi:MAG: ornithine carbamoyltransferase, partial [Candidatus Lokiarchaeota archaeon]|nr:ornithine carbamoyltransferase [Candidatus Lokiarchaeota archaeon]MBD3338649.1 ornithine carbamoyltransferase [Candidatus Lokiarchaeota archaeon]
SDAIMARVYGHETLEVISDASEVPVINGLSDKYHPCQILADLMTIKEVYGTFDNVKVAWSGDGNNVCNSLIVGCVTLGVPIAVATPTDYRPHRDVLDWVQKGSQSSKLELLTDPRKAIEQANVIYTDTFVSMGQESESEERLKIFKPYQINTQLLEYAKKDPIIMHCLPAHRGTEITSEVLDSNRSVIFKQAENRLHIQKAILLNILEKT